ncbi:unnamed protein product [Rodentolepis nana]|uniref:methylated diphthine methylhydrolase n=1 Tax=Rodentolepis nana TaxID=102285 RepID=A0A0R3TTI2_RODNA|nr:unnamed protein product [Rodentolepis nana]
MSFSEISSWTLRLHTDAVEFSPSGSQALIGTYELNESTRERYGSVICYEISPNQANKSFEIDLPGVLDLSWMCPDLCLVASSSGEIYTIQSHPSQPLTVHSINKVSESLLLSIDFNSNKIVTSDADGFIYLINASDNHVICKWKAHEYEPWCAQFNRNDDYLLLTGGDDCMARVWDQRVGFSQSVFDQKHEMGVCSLYGVPMHSHLISTGCFDEKLRLWDLRKTRSDKPEELVVFHSEGGGVWRHKWSPNGHHVLMACMHAGFAVVHVTHFGSDDLKPVATAAFYRPTEKLAYGVDWQINNGSSDQFEAQIGTCSFYDNCVSFATYRDSTA